MVSEEGEEGIRAGNRSDVGSQSPFRVRKKYSWGEGGTVCKYEWAEQGAHAPPVWSV